MYLIFGHERLLADVVVHGFSFLEIVALLSHRGVLGLHHLLEDVQLVAIDAPPLDEHHVDVPVDDRELFNQIEFEHLCEALSEVPLVLKMGSGRSPLALATFDFLII